METRSMILRCALTVVVLSTSCAAPPAVDEARSQKPLREVSSTHSELKVWERGSTDFAYRLYGELSTRDGNLVVSPFGVGVVLSMALAGARGRSAEQLVTALGYGECSNPHAAVHEALSVVTRLSQDADSSSAEGLAVRQSSFVWLQRGMDVRPEFLESLAEYYGAGAHFVDFSAGPVVADLINEWAEDQTAGRFAEVVDASQISSSTRALLLNAIHFESKWGQQFELERTHNRAFQRRGGSIDVPMMEIQGEYEYARGVGFQVLFLPYENYAGAMLLLLPDEGMLEQIESSLSVDLLMSAFENLSTYEVLLRLPRFAFESSLTLREALEGLGVALPFLSGDADFSGIASEPLFLTDVVQRAAITVDEEGTVATAVSASEFSLGGGPDGFVTLEFDRPFLFAVFHESLRSPLFLGRVADPTH